MYLVTAVLERKDDKPVPLSVLAERLSVSPVSANEMCHKMTERGLVEYQPYKGIVLTDEGEVLAQRVLNRRRIWEDFLQHHLGIEPQEADEIACQLEHITSDRLIESLAAYLDRPHPSPQARENALPLTALAAGQCGQIITLPPDDTLKSFFTAQGVGRGSVVRVLAVGCEGTLLLDRMQPFPPGGSGRKPGGKSGGKDEQPQPSPPFSLSAALAAVVQVVVASPHEEQQPDGL
jgi:DtxR family Mn-dependent transcriptional regulator